MTDLSDVGLVLLAAGASARYGTDDKLLADIGGMPLIERALATYAPVSFGRRIAVVRPDSRVTDICDAAGFDHIVNKTAENGMGSSISVGIGALQGLNYALIGLGDMPYVKPKTIAEICAAKNTPHDIIIPTYQGARGHPVLFGAAHFTALAQLQGDTGGRDIIAACPTVLELAVDDAAIRLDIDTPEDRRNADV